jgi:hypothetical protein
MVALLLAAMPVVTTASEPQLLAKKPGAVATAGESMKEKMAKRNATPISKAAGLQTDRPDGDYKVYSREGSSLFYDWDGIYSVEQGDFLAEIVFAANGDVWFRNLLTYVNDNVWVKGTLSSDGTKISIPAGVELSYDKWIGEYVYLYPCTLSLDDYTAIVDSDVSEITFTVSDGKISLDNTGDYKGVGVFYASGEWEGNMDVKTVFEPYDLTAVSVPNGLSTARYQLIALNENYSEGVDLDNQKGVFVNVGRDGNDIYIGGLLSNDPSLWVKGTVSGSVVTFPQRQFMGVSNGYGLYLVGCTYTTETYDWGWSSYTFNFSDDELTFNISDNGSLTSASLAVVITNSLEYVAQFDAYINPEITSAYDGAATPKTPTFTSVNCWEDEYGEPYYALAIRTSQIDNENHLLDRSKMYYEVDVNGENFTFDPEVYTTLDEPMKEVPLEFDDNDYFISYDNFQNFYIFRNDITSFGVRVVYYGGGERTATPTTLYEVAGVDAVVADADNSDADVYDLMGRKVNRDNLAPGIYIINHKKYLVK